MFGSGTDWGLVFETLMTVAALPHTDGHTRRAVLEGLCSTGGTGDRWWTIQKQAVQCALLPPIIVLR